MEDILGTPEEFITEEEEEYDEEIYEKIEAPKFVDFTLPDKPLPDDRSWFCLRIGCDQDHEVVDPDALHKSFVLRVLAARSPNLQFCKALRKQSTSANRKCPLSAPAKPSRPMMTRMTDITLISQKTINDKGKAHPISKLNSTPNTKATVAAKALTTPSHKKGVPMQNPFQSVRNPKTPVAAVPKNNLVAKCLVFNSQEKIGTTKTPLQSQTPVTEICAGMKKLGINSQSKKLSENSNKSSRVIASSFSKSFSGSASSKSKLYSHKSTRRVKVSTIITSQERKSARSMKSKITTKVLESHGPQPQDIVDKNSSNMKIDGKLSNASLDVNSVSVNSKNDEGRGNKECLDVVMITVGATDATKKDCLQSSETSFCRENVQAVSTDISSSKRVGSLSSSDKNLEKVKLPEQDEDNKENEHERRIDSIPKEKDSEEQEHFIVFQASLPNSEINLEKEELPEPRASERGRDEDTKDNEHERHIDLTPKDEKVSQEQKDTIVLQTSNRRVRAKREAKASDDKENAATSDVNSSKPNNNHSQRQTGQQKTPENNQKVTDGCDKTSICVSTVAANGKLKKIMSTKPKPFRLRTDERGTLREANLERNQIRTLRENTILVPTDGNLQRKHGNVEQTKPTHLIMSKRVLERKMADSRTKKTEFSTEKADGKLTYQRKHVSTYGNLQRKHENEQQTRHTSKKALKPKMSESRIKKPEVDIEKAGRKFAYHQTTKSQLYQQQLTRPQRVTETQLSVIKESSYTSRPKDAKAEKNVPTFKGYPSVVASATSRSSSRGRRDATVLKDPIRQRAPQRR